MAAGEVQLAAARAADPGRADGGAAAACERPPGAASADLPALDHEARMRRAAQQARVPDTRSARLALWAVAGLASALAAGDWGAGRASWQVGRGTGGCELQAAGLGPPCACAHWPARLRLLLGVPLDLARASAADLEQLPGIGPARAAAIARARDAAGGALGAADLARLPGIGARTAERLAPYLSAGAGDSGAQACAAAIALAPPQTAR